MLAEACFPELESPWPMPDLASLVIQELRHRVVVGFPEQVRASLVALSDQELWARPNPKSNSVGNLVLHLCGSSRHFLGHVVGGCGYARDRAAEFAFQGPLPRAELLRILEETVAEQGQVLDALDPARLLEVKEGAQKPFTVVELLLRVSHHWAVHAGQIVFHAKALHPEAFEELWMKTMERR
jgi:uncharacterized damage-inducible protein DinB